MLARNTLTEDLEKVHHLAQDIDDHLIQSLETLEERLIRVENELDLESDNLRDLINTHNPVVNHQLDSLSRSITDLHTSLREVRGHLRTAHQEAHEIVTQFPVPKKPQPPMSTHSEPEMSGRQASWMRHDEPVTLGGIVRGLLMADSPAQREHKKW